MSHTIPLLPITQLTSGVVDLTGIRQTIGEPATGYGPIVMNTQEELRVAFEEYRTGAFIKHKTPLRE